MPRMMMHYRIFATGFAPIISPTSIRMMMFLSLSLLTLSKNSDALAPGFVVSTPLRIAERCNPISSSFSEINVPTWPSAANRRDRTIFNSISPIEEFKEATTSSAVSSRRLVSLLKSADSDSGESNEALRMERIRDIIASLEVNYVNGTHDDVDRFTPLIGLYRVQQVLSRLNDKNNKNNNPVGGKWTRSNGIAQRIFRTRNSFQHILPVNSTSLSPPNNSRANATTAAVAEAINVVSLDALNGAFRVTVILRGDAVPLSKEELGTMNANRTSSEKKKSRANGGENETLDDGDDDVSLDQLSDRTVRAYFDPPRIFLGKRRRKRFRPDNGDSDHDGQEYTYIPLAVGPPSDVVLDTSYCDDVLRIGVGGTSGTRFVFTRCGTIGDVGDKSMNAAAVDDVETSEIANTSGMKTSHKSDSDHSKQIEEEAKEYQILLRQPPAEKAKVLTRLGAILAISLCMASGNGANVVSAAWSTFQTGAMLILAKLGIHANWFSRGGAEARIAKVSLLSAAFSQVKSPSIIVHVLGRWMGIGVRVVAGVAAIIASLVMGLISFSSGGIERDGMAP
mmetsp:Transcript_3039/g.6579  ORF Transcript_3039/g.6579 Transcript_3039/m.6579 type:complete len:565 (-) Transcript_3039:80-1774(-)